MKTNREESIITSKLSERHGYTFPVDVSVSKGRGNRAENRNRCSIYPAPDFFAYPVIPPNDAQSYQTHMGYSSPTWAIYLI